MCDLGERDRGLHTEAVQAPRWLHLVFTSSETARSEVVRSEAARYEAARSEAAGWFNTNCSACVSTVMMGQRGSTLPQPSAYRRQTRTELQANTSTQHHAHQNTPSTRNRVTGLSLSSWGGLIRWSLLWEQEGYHQSCRLAVVARWKATSYTHTLTNTQTHWQINTHTQTQTLTHKVEDGLC